MNRCAVGRFPGVRGSWLLPVLLFALLPTPSYSQSVYGRVIIEGDTLGVSGAELTLSDSTGAEVARVQSTDGGEFRLPAPGAGKFFIRASRIGLSTIDVEVVLRDDEAMEVELQMAEEAIPLEPLLVVGRRQIKEGTLDQFYDRMARMKQEGKGQFLNREEIEARRGLSLTMTLQTVPGVWAPGSGQPIQLVSAPGMGGGFCTPNFYLDGLRMPGGFRELDSTDLEGIEVYRGFTERVDGIEPNDCGNVFLWRRADWGNPFDWGRALLAVGAGAIIWALSSLF